MHVMKKYLQPFSLYSGPLNGTEKVYTIWMYAVMRKGLQKLYKYLGY